MVSKQVNLINGVFENGSGVNCTLTVNGLDYVVTPSQSYNWVFGHVRYNCGNITENVISTPSCTDCGIYCAHNDKINGCQHIWFPIIIGSLISIILFFALKVSVFWVYRKMHPVIMGKINKTRDNRKIKRKDKRKTELKQFLNDREIEQSRAPTPPPSPTSSLYPKLNFGPNPFTTIAIILCIILSALGCDQTLYIHSDGQLCNILGKCQTISTYTFSLTSLNEICFNSYNGKIVRFKMESIELIDRYIAIYRTSDFDVSVDSTWRCKGSGNCWNGACTMNQRHESFKTRDTPHGFGCDTDTLGCDTMCWHKTSCTWYNWFITMSGPKGKVFQFDSRVWQLSLLVVQDDIQVRKIFNTNNPSMDIGVGELFKNIELPISISNVFHSDLMISPSVLEYSNSYYYVNARELNFPMPRQVGDLQLELDSDKFIVEPTSVTCTVASCKSYCMIPKPAIRTIQNNTRPIDNKVIRMDNGNQLLIHHNILGSINIMLGNRDLQSLHLMKAFCHLSVLKTYGCTGCNQLPYMVLQSTNIKGEGIINIISNCSLERKYLSCNKDLYSIKFKEHYDTCMIQVPLTNQTIIVNLEYEFVGKLYTPAPLFIQSTDIGEIVETLFTNPSFFKSINFTLISATLITFLISVFSRLYIRLVAYRAVKKNIDKSIPNAPVDV